MLDSFAEGASPVANPVANSVATQDAVTDPRPTAVIEVVACDGAETASLVVAAQGLGAEVRVVGAVEAWFDQLSRHSQNAGPIDAPHPLADVVVLAGGGERIATQRWVARAVAAAADSRVVAALSDSTLDHAMNVVGQGARGLLILPNSAERIAFHLREAVEAALRDQPDRRAAAKHRQAMTTLTAGENQVLDRMLEGLANKQIAQQLSIGLRTVELRRSKIMRKMGAASLAQLISFVCRARN